MVAAGEFFAFRPDWHQDDRARPVVRQYQTALDAILRDHPGLATCAVRCRHCFIRFLTHPRNAKRQDLHCPFGCREHHRRRQANQRSKKHYQTDEGFKNKKRLNGRRSAAGRTTESAQPEIETADTTLVSSCGAPSACVGPRSHPAPPLPDPTHRPTLVDLEASHAEVKLLLDGFTLDAATLASSPMLPYLAMVATVIERRAIHFEELLPALRRSMRQRSFDRLPRREYVLRFLDRHPP